MPPTNITTFWPVIVLMYKHSLSLNFPHLDLPLKIYSNPNPLASPILVLALATVEPLARCILSSVHSNSIAKANILFMVFPALTAPSATFIVLFLHLLIYSLCFSPKFQLIVLVFLIFIYITIYFFIYLRQILYLCIIASNSVYVSS